MPVPPSSDITALLVAWGRGDAAALADLVPLVYQELRRQAEHYLRCETPGHTLQATALVHEAYLRLVDQRQVHFHDRAHFFGVAAQVMRRVLCDQARARHSVKRGGGASRLTLGNAAAEVECPAVDVEALDEALTRLGELDERQSRLVELRYFCGLSIEETAAVMGLSPATVKREWTMARAWLKLELGRD
jgi:RNA polymerase sigma factor (TIGR02999 family)